MGWKLKKRNLAEVVLDRRQDYNDTFEETANSSTVDLLATQLALVINGTWQPQASNFINAVSKQRLVSNECCL